MFFRYAVLLFWQSSTSNHYLSILLPVAHHHKGSCSKGFLVELVYSLKKSGQAWIDKQFLTEAVQSAFAFSWKVDSSEMEVPSVLDSCFSHKYAVTSFQLLFPLVVTAVSSSIFKAGSLTSNQLNFCLMMVTLNGLLWLTNLWASNSRLNWNLDIFEERGRPECGRKTSCSKDENQQQTEPSYDSKSGNQTHLWDMSALTTAKSLLSKLRANATEPLSTATCTLQTTFQWCWETVRTQ